MKPTKTIGAIDIKRINLSYDILSDLVPVKPL
jgi:hypothetical protein